MSSGLNRVAVLAGEVVDRNLPREVTSWDTATRRRARICVVLPFIGAIAALLALITQISLNRPAAGQVVTSFGVVVALAMTQLVRVFRSVAVAGQVLTAVTFLFMSVSASIAGGLGTPRGFSLVLVPSIATLLVGWRAALFWFAAVVAEVAVLFALTFVGPVAVVVDPHMSQRAHAAGIIIIGAVIIFVIASYDRANASVAENLEAALERADAASRLKSALVANVSHELRTPLNGVLGSTDLLLHSELDEAQRSHAETIESASSALLRLVDGLLDMSRLEAGGMQLEAEAVELRHMLGQTLAAFGGPAEAKSGLRLVLHVDRNVPEHIVADQYRLRQVLTNLLNNALKFTGTGHIILRVSYTDEKFCFEVSDTGIGIAPKDQARLFHAFEQAHVSTARNYGGTGLGLNISQHLVQLMGGQIEIESEVGVGTAFGFQLDLPLGEAKPSGEQPARYRVALDLSDHREKAAANEALSWAGHSVVELSQEHDVVVAENVHGDEMRSVLIVPPSQMRGSSTGEIRVARPFAAGRLDHAVWRVGHGARSSRPSVAASRAGRGRVLVADDNLVNRRVAAGLLEHLGFEPVLVENGLEAVEAVKNAKVPFVAIFIDLSMPLMDGHEAAEALRAWEREEGREPVTLWALTAHALGEQRSRATKAGFDRFFAKPLRLRDLETILAKHRSGLYPAVEQVSAAVVDDDAWSELELLAEGDSEFLKTLVEGFLQNSARQLEQLGKADVHQVSELGHALKGAARQLGANSLAEVCQRLEEHPEERDELFSQLVAQHQRASTTLLERVS